MILGWWLINHTYTTEGVLLTLLGDLSQTPWLVRTRAWDVVAMLALLHVVTVYKVAQGLFTSAGL